MYKQTPRKVSYDYLSIPKLQMLRRWIVEIDE